MSHFAPKVFSGSKILLMLLSVMPLSLEKVVGFGIVHIFIPGVVQEEGCFEDRSLMKL